MTGKSALRRALDLFYVGCGVLAGVSLVAIAALVILQVVARLLGIVLTWTPEFAGYAMASSSFLALAYTFNTNGHIRVGMLLNALSPRARRWLDIPCLIVGLWIVGYFAWSTVVMTWQSYEFNSMGQGSFPVPLWVPQLPMALGTVALAVALADNLLLRLRNRAAAYDSDGSSSVL